MRISLITTGLINWGGGIDLIHYIAAIISASDYKIEDKQLILPKGSFLIFIKKLYYPIRILCQNILNKKKFTWSKRPGFSNKYIQNEFRYLEKNYKIINSDFSLESQIKTAIKFHSNIILPCTTPPKLKNSLNWVGYLFDFQHKHLPEFFTPDEIKKRDFDFNRMLNEAKMVIVNAKSVENDAQQFIKSFTANIIVLPFSPCPKVNWLNDNRDVRLFYGINKPYFMISNQFWKHKNHITAFKAFAEFINSGRDALLVCTGTNYDYRFPHYRNELMKLLIDLKIESRVKVLGHIPKLDQISLIKKCLAIIQPTLFEGGPGGGAGFDAISLGKHLIASDIKTNLEINIGDVSFFESMNHYSLFEAMVDRGTKEFDIPDSEILWSKGIERLRFGGNYLINALKNNYK